VLRLVSGLRSLYQFSYLLRFISVTLMNLILFFWLNGLFITTLVTCRMTQIRYTCDQLIDLRTCAAGRSLPSDVIARMNSLTIRRRGCRAERKVKLKLQRRALGVHYSHPNDIDFADDGHQRPIPTIITDRSVTSSPTLSTESPSQQLVRVHLQHHLSTSRRRLDECSVCQQKD